MKKIFFFITTILFLNLKVIAQLPDSIYATYDTISNKSAKSKFLIEYFFSAYQDNLYLSIQFLEQVSKSFESKKDNFGYFHSETALSTKYWRTGDYDKSIAKLMKILPDAEKYNDTNCLIYIYNTLSISLTDSKNYENAIKYTHKILSLIHAKSQNDNIIVQYNNLADIFLKIENKDSALYYINQALFLIQSSKDYYIKMLVNITAGEYYFNYKEYDFAKAFFDKALWMFPQNEDRSLHSYSLLMKSKIFEIEKNTDSAIYYANRAYCIALPDLKTDMMSATQKLHDYYSIINNKDSMYLYLKIYQDLKDSIFNIENISLIKQLQIKEDIRLQQKADEQAQRDKERKNILQLFAISIIVIAFIIFVFIYRVKNPTARTLDFLGIFAALLLFEFISLLLHPFFEKITHHNPFLMLVCLMIVGAFIAPLHHKMTSFIKSKTKK